jgi:hypothetical protein
MVTKNRLLFLLLLQPKNVNLIFSAVCLFIYRSQIPERFSVSHSRFWFSFIYFKRQFLVKIKMNLEIKSNLIRNGTRET